MERSVGASLTSSTNTEVCHVDSRIADTPTRRRAATPSLSMVQPPTRQRRQRLQHSALRRSVQESVPQGQWNPTKRARGNVAKFQGRNFLTAILLTHVEVGSTPRCAAFSRRCAVFFRPFGHPHPSVTVYDRCTRRWAARGRGKRCGGPPNACRSVRCVLCGCMRRFVAAAAAVGCLGVPALLQVACGGQVLPETVERKAPKARRGDDAVCVWVCLLLLAFSLLSAAFGPAV